MWALAGLFVFIFGGGIISVATEHSAGSSGRTIPVICVLAVLGIVHVFFAVRSATAAVFTDDEGVRVRNTFTTLRLLWDDIDRFELRGEGREARACVLILRDGSEIKAHGISSGYRWFPTSTSPAPDLVDALNAELRATRALRAH
jgi:hypothetical protein